jgi:hypothetical protein
MTFGCGGAGVVVVGVVVVAAVVVGAVVVVPVVVPSSAPAPGAVARRSATIAPAAPQDERAAIVTPRFTPSVYLRVPLPVHLPLR